MRMAGIKNFSKQLRLSAAACRLIHEKLIFLVAREFTRHQESREKVCWNFILRLSSHSLPLNAKNTMFSPIFPKRILWHHNFPCRCFGDVNVSQKKKWENENVSIKTTRAEIADNFRIILGSSLHLMWLWWNAMESLESRDYASMSHHFFYEALVKAKLLDMCRSLSF